MEKTEKAAVISEVEDKLREAKTTVLADYRGLTVKEISQLRRELSAEGVDFKVYKNTLVKRAVDNSKIDDLGEHLVGPTAVAFSYEDPIAPIKLLAKFAKTNNALALKCGLMEGNFLDAAGIKAVAALPSREALLGSLVGTLQAPISGLANVLSAPYRGLAVALNQIAEGKNE